MNRPNTPGNFSLKRRALVYLSLFFLLFFLVFAYLLNTSVERALTASMQEQLSLQIKLLLANIEVDSEGRLEVFSIEEPRLKKVDSDLRAYVYTQGDIQPVWVSPSVDLTALRSSDSFLWNDSSMRETLEAANLGESQFVSLAGGFVHTYTAAFEFSGDAGGLDNSLGSEEVSVPYTLVLFDNGETYMAQKGAFQRALAAGLAVALLVFLGLQYLILRWLFKPLADIDLEINAIEQGQQKHFEHTYPSELSPLTQRLNHFIDNERLQRERYKNTLSDLAHSIKTPLAVIRTLPDSSSSDKDRAVAEQVDRMEQIVNHQLRRSAIPALDGIGYRTDAIPIVGKMLNSLYKLYPKTKLAIENKLPEQLFVAMPEDDLYEILGNILDNAFKYSEQKIILKAEEIPGKESEKEGSAKRERHGVMAKMSIKNDGAPITHEQASQVLKRGRRLDERAEGQGLGLSVAASITESYGGEVLIQPENLFTSVTVVLPLA